MIETYLEGIIQCLSTCPVVSAFNVTREEVGEEDGYIRIKCNLSNGDTLEFAEVVGTISMTLSKVLKEIEKVLPTEHE